MKEFWKKIIKKSVNPQSISVGILSIGMFTFISKILGFLRDVIVADQFGTSWRLDGVFLALQPTTDITSILVVAVSSAMIPVIIGYDKRELKDDYLFDMLRLTSLILLIYGIFLFLFPDFFVRIFAPGFSLEAQDYSLRKIRILSALPLLQGASGIFSAALRAERKFIQYSMIQVVFNVVTIPFLLVFSSGFGETAYLISWILGTLAMDLFLILLFRKEASLKRLFTPGFSKNALKTLVIAMPLMVGNSISTINNIVDKIFASKLPAGSVSSLHYSYKLLSMINAIISTSFLSATFTEMAEYANKNDMENLKRSTVRTFDVTMRIIVPVSFWIVLMANPIITLLFQRGSFDADSTSTVSSALIAYGFSIIIFPVYALATNTFVALKDTKIINLTAMMSLFLNLFFDWLLVDYFGHVGIALSSTLVNLFAAVIICGILRRKYGIFFINLKSFFKLLAIFVIYLISGYVCRNYLSSLIWILCFNSVFIILFYIANRSLIIKIVKMKRTRGGK